MNLMGNLKDAGSRLLENRKYFVRNVRTVTIQWLRPCKGRLDDSDPVKSGTSSEIDRPTFIDISFCIVIIRIWRVIHCLSHRVLKSLTLRSSFTTRIREPQRCNGFSNFKLAYYHTMPSTQSSVSIDSTARVTGSDDAPVNQQPPPALAMSIDNNGPGQNAMRLRGGCCCVSYSTSRA